jgi:hypothetical protein
MALGGLLRSFFKNKKPEDWAGILPPEGTTQFPGQEGLDPYTATGPGSRGFHQQYMPQPGQQSTLMRNTPGRQSEGPAPATHIPFIPIDALRHGMSNVPYAQSAMANTNMGPLQKMMSGLDMGRLRESFGDTMEMYKDKNLKKSWDNYWNQEPSTSPGPSHIPFAPTEGLTDPNYLFRQQYGA